MLMSIGKNKGSKKKHREQGTNDQTEEQINEWMIAKLKMNKQETKNIWKEAYTAKRKKEMYGDKNI